MAEEKKEEQKAEIPATPEAAREPGQEAPAAAPEPKVAKAEAAPQAAVPASPAPAAKEEKKEASPAKKEKPANCAGCKKSIRKKRWYYRNGSYYCTKRCWTSVKKKAEIPQETAPAS